jgi:hypothetical protein
MRGLRLRLFCLLLFVPVAWGAVVSRVCASEGVGADVKNEWESLIGSIQEKILTVDFDRQKRLEPGLARVAALPGR